MPFENHLRRNLLAWDLGETRGPPSNGLEEALEILAYGHVQGDVHPPSGIGVEVNDRIAHDEGIGDGDAAVVPGPKGGGDHPKVLHHPLLVGDEDMVAAVERARGGDEDSCGDIGKSRLEGEARDNPEDPKANDQAREVDVEGGEGEADHGDDQEDPDGPQEELLLNLGKAALGDDATKAPHHRPDDEITHHEDGRRLKTLD
jgi:hypothetical protein